MKKIYSLPLSLFLLSLLLLAPLQQSRACDLTFANLDSVVYNGSAYDIYVTVCVGGGVVGSSMGAGGNTRSFAFNFYGGPGMVGTPTGAYFTPSVTSDTTGAVYPGIDVPGGFMGSRFAVMYADPGLDYACIYSTVICGTNHQDCKQFQFSVTELPDSIRALGYEGGGNPIGGCYPNGDMLLTLETFPVVWGNISAEPTNGGVQVQFSTQQEVNNRYFEILRSGDGTAYEVVGKVDAEGNSNSLTEYGFFDPNPVPGTNYYKINQVDLDGKNEISQVTSAQYNPPAGMSLTRVYPNPVRDQLELAFVSGESGAAQLSLTDLQGRSLQTEAIEVLPGENSQKLQLSDFAPGMYIVNLKMNGTQLQQKIMKL